MKPVIAIDFDYVCNDMLLSWVAYLNGTYMLNIKARDIVEWDMRKNYPMLSEDKVYGPLSSASFWRCVYVYPEVNRIIQEMKDCGFDVVIVTDTDYRTAKIKIDNCILPALKDVIDVKDIICTSRKYLIDCAYIIDDNPVNLKDSKAYRILINAPYNQDASKEDFDIRKANIEAAWTYIHQREDYMKKLIEED